MKRMTERLKSRDKVDNLKAGDIISIYTVFVRSALPNAKLRKRALQADYHEDAI